MAVFWDMERAKQNIFKISQLSCRTHRLCVYWLWENFFEFSFQPIFCSFWLLLTSLIEVSSRIKIIRQLEMSIFFNWLNFISLYSHVSCFLLLPLVTVQHKYWDIGFGCSTSTNAEYLTKWKYPGGNWNLFDWYAVQWTAIGRSRCYDYDWSHA